MCDFFWVKNSWDLNQTFSIVSFCIGGQFVHSFYEYGLIKIRINNEYYLVNMNFSVVIFF